MIWLQLFKKKTVSSNSIYVELLHICYYNLLIKFIELLCLFTFNLYGKPLYDNIYTYYDKYFSIHSNTMSLNYELNYVICYYKPFFFSLQDYLTIISYYLNPIRIFKNLFVLYKISYNNFMHPVVFKFISSFLMVKSSNYRVIFFSFSKKQCFYNIVSSFYYSCKTFFLPLLCTIVLLLIIIDFYNIIFLRQVAIWFVIGIIFFWLMSGFNFFLKRYRFGKFTSAIQRFWKRTNTYFWIIEGFLFSLFFYYYLNSSQEVLYFFDEANLNQTFLTNLSSFYFSSALLLFLIFYSIYIMLNISSFTFKQHIFHLKLITVFFVYGFLLETYQFYYVITGFFELNWEFLEKGNIWTLETLSPWIRVKNQYLTLALIAKYWHFLFIFISWLFMIFKSYESKKINYTLFGVNLQNYMLLFILNLLFNINWLKWLTRRHYDEIYYWFFSDFNNWYTSLTTEELFTFFSNLLFLNVESYC